MKHLRTLLLLAILLLSGLEAQAQIQISLKMDRQLYVAHEPITGKLTIVNRSGRDLIFGDSNGMSWLDFTVTNGRGHLISPIRRALNERPIVLSAGQTYEHDVTINRYDPMSATGTYRVKASVSFPQINRVFNSRNLTIQVTDGQPMWSQIVGVPQGYANAGQYREYSLMTFYMEPEAKRSISGCETATQAWCTPLTPSEITCHCVPRPMRSIRRTNSMYSTCRVRRCIDILSSISMETRSSRLPITKRAPIARASMSMPTATWRWLGA